MLIPSDQPAVALGQVAQLDQALQGARAKEVQLTQEMQERSSAYRSWKKTAVLDMSQHVSAFKTLDRIVLLCNVDWVLVQLFNAVCQLSLHFSMALTVLEVINGSSEPLGITGSFGGSQTSPKRTEGLGGAWGTAPAQWLHIAPCFAIREADISDALQRERNLAVQLAKASEDRNEHLWTAADLM